jgi:hypothetical protein
LALAVIWRWRWLVLAQRLQGAGDFWLRRRSIFGWLVAVFGKSGGGKGGFGRFLADLAGFWGEG